MRAFIFLIAIFVTACSHSSRSAERAGIDAALQKFIPPDTVMLLATRIDELRNTPVYQKYFEPRRFAAIQEFAAKTGLDPSRDLLELLYASNGTDGVALGRGNFSPEVRQRWKDRDGAVALGANLAAIGPPAMLKSLTEHGGVPEALEPLLDRIQPGSQFWAVFDGRLPKLPVDERSNLDNLNRLLGGVTSGFFYADFQATGLKSMSAATCTTDKEAEDLMESLRSIVSLARVNTKSSETELLSLYDSIRIAKEAQNRISMQLDVPEPAVEKFLDIWMGRAK